ncbi:MAG TPA: PstS family phosphate ABC transporter substrate-binding protein [Fimbriimonas sp.]|nr:PstS family phosphate ABC transporter substrate-binding protein [Fimbriimonas sp.]
MTIKFGTYLLSALFASALLTGCGNKAANDPAGEPSAPTASDTKVSGTITIDGSSTVEPISTSLSEIFQEGQKEVKISVAESGTGGGFKKFAGGEIDIAGASRPIEAEEIEECKKNGIEFIEVPIAYDGLTIVVNKDNSVIDDITVAELKKIWEPSSKVKTWADVRAGLPTEKINLFGPGDKSGTFDYFTEAIVGKKKSSRPDYQASEDDNVLVTGVSGDKWALGYFGYSYFEENQDKLKALKVDGVGPSPETVLDGTYKPLSRPLFLYVSVKAMEKPQVAAFVKFAVENAEQAIKDAKFIPLSHSTYELVKKNVESKRTGSLFQGVAPGAKLDEILSAPSKP